MRKRILRSLFLAGVLFFSVGILIENLLAASDPFPLYECLKPNVEFWKKIYTRYSSNQGVLHDSSDVSIIYEVIDLVDPQKPNSRRINMKRIRESKRKYQSILEKLSRQESPSGSEEERIAALFGPAAGRSDFLAARRNLRCQVGQMDRFREGLIRSGAFLEEIKQIFQSYGLPSDLAYLPHVESSFNQKAYSKFGAAGIWQFMRSTGKRFMEIGYTIDERRDPIRSSHAAAKLLKQNYETLGDWPTAITAYNHGLSGMLRAKRSRGSYEEIFRRHQSRFFQFASRNFYSEFLAARDVANNYRQYFGEIDLEEPLNYREIVLTGYVPVHDLVRDSDLDVDIIRRLNPALREPVYRGQKHIPKGYALRLPPAKEESPEKDYLLLAQRVYEPEQKRSLFYTVQRGDTASEVAHIHGVALSQLRLANNLDRKATIYPGQKLHIPASDHEIEGVKIVGVVAEKHVPAVQTEPAPGTKSIPDAGEEAGIPQESPEPIEDGESGSGPSPAEEDQVPQVASREDVPEEGDTSELDDGEAGEPNFVAGDLVDERIASLQSTPQEASSPEPGDEIRSDELRAKPSIAAEDLVILRVTSQNGRVIGLIRTAAEETLGHYADWLSVPTQAIRKLNGFSYGRMLKIHEFVKIPLNKDKASKEDFEEKRLEYHEQMQEDFFAAYEIENVRIHRIRAGDNLWTLCREVFDVPIWLVVNYNPDLDFGSLRPSQKLLVPVLRGKVDALQNTAEN